MWILPKQLHTSAYVPDTAALSLDLNESSQLCAQSLFVRSKPSPLRTWLQKWKRDSWTQHLYGRILRPSHGKSFEIRWTFFLAGSRANHSPAPANEPETKTVDTSSRTFWRELDNADLPLFSLKMLKESSPANSLETTGTTQQERPFCFMSSGSWSVWVTRQRQAYSARLSAARATSANECSSWPTCATRDWKGTSPGYLTRLDGKSRVDQLPVAVDQAEAGNWPTPTVQEAGKIGNQANHGQTALSNHPALRGEVTRQKFEKGKHGPPDQGNHSTHGSRLESWATPVGRDWMDNGTTLPPSIGKTRGFSLGQQMVTTPTPGKLNSRWVETLMNLPVGWTMPSCASPVTIEQTSCASLATE